MTETETTNKQAAIATFLDVDTDNVELASYDLYGLEVYKYGGQEYAIGTDDEADEACKSYSADTLWAFNASFLMAYFDHEGGQTEEALQAMQEKLCESANPIIAALVGESFGDLVIDAISSDGRGHFLAGYDGDEAEQEHNGETYYIYRIN